MAGAPTVRTPRAAQRVCAALAKGHTVVAAAAAGGLAVSSLNEWRREDAAFAAAVEQAKLVGRERLEGFVLDGTEGDPRHALEVLSRLHPKAWGRKDKLELGGAVRLETERLAKLSPAERLDECLRVRAELDAEIEELRAQLGAGGGT